MARLKPANVPILLLGTTIALAACGADAVNEAEPDPPYLPPPETCAPASAADPTAFVPCSTGGGIFGAWSLDRHGLPGYDYGLDQNADPRAQWDVTEDKERRDHWASFGNARVTALASNDGYIELTTQDRGVTYLAKVDEEAHAYGGGFGFVDDGEATWTTAYKWRPRGARTTRRFGMGYAEATMLHRDVFASRTTYAPAGDKTWLISEVTLENRSAAAKRLAHYEYWDVRRRPIEIDWIVSGKPLRAAPATVATRRDSRNALFDEQVRLDGKLLGLRRTQLGPAPPRAEPDPIDHYPGDPFLAAIDAPIDAVYTDDARFFGDGDPSAPRAVIERAPGDDLATHPTRNGAGQPRLFVIKSNVDLAPGERRTLRFAYGYTGFAEPWPDVASSATLETTLSEQRRHLLSFATEREPFLHRELAWHASQMEASVGYREYWGRHVVPQGSAYLYLHGADGALRDTALFALPLVYTHPALAKEQLALAMGLAFAEDSRFTYAFQGHGVLDDAVGLHASPSDLDLFFLLAMHEYLGATGDLAFLDERVSYFPKKKENEVTALDHVRRAVLHLLDGVGFGEHGLLRIGTGDWSDGIVLTAPDRDLAIAKGESVPNSQMALAVLPGIADLLDAHDAPLAKRIRDVLPALRASVDATFTGTFYGRAYFGDGVLRHTSKIDLEAQVWPLIGETTIAPALVDSIVRELDDPSPVGAPLEKGGHVWPAIAQLLTWGYTRVDDERAFMHLAKTSLASRARAHPNVWYHVWSGPDGASSKSGETWSSPVTPMTDFPTMNMNVHAMALLAALRVAGIEARADGLTIEPHVPDRRLALRSELVDLDLTPEKLHVEWRPAPNVPRTLVVKPPRGKRLASLTISGTTAPIIADATFADP